MKFVSRLSVLAVSAAFLGLVAVGQASAGGTTVISANSTSSYAKGSVNKWGSDSKAGGRTDSIVMATGSQGAGDAGGHYSSKAKTNTSTGSSHKPSMGSREQGGSKGGSSSTSTSASASGGGGASASVGGCGCAY